MGSFQLTGPLALFLRVPLRTDPCWPSPDLQPSRALVPDKHFPFLISQSHFSSPPGIQIPLSYSCRPLHHLTCFSVEALPSCPFAVAVCPGLLTSVTTLCESPIVFAFSASSKRNPCDSASNQLFLSIYLLFFL